MTIKTYSFEDGKYEFDRDTDTHRLLAARRYRGPWTVIHTDMQHAKFFHAMLNRIDELESLNKELESLNKELEEKRRTLQRQLADIL